MSFDGQEILDEVLEHLEWGKRYRNYISGLCPFHEDSRPSLIVHADRFECLACGEMGRTDYLLSVISSSPIKHYKQTSFFNPWTRWLRRNSLKEILFYAQEYLRAHPSIYMRKRCISDEQQQKIGLGIREGWILFPIDEQGAVARDTDENSTAKYICPSGQDPNLIYVPDRNMLKISKYAICTFGIIDAISLYVLGAPAFSTTNGKRINPDALDDIRKPIIFWPDRGEEDAAERIAYQLGWRGHVAYHDYPSDSKDPNDMLVKHKDILTEWIHQTEDEMD
jgi:hypothetical protein